MTETPYERISDFITKARPDLYPSDHDAAQLIWNMMDNIPVGESATTGGFRFDRTEDGLNVSLVVGFVADSISDDGDWTWLGTELEELFFKE